ncbi:uncharacterized protein B0H18DRAFT_97408 [Fomitopsis serialis]|uniref:uncharacterized protein n=1 Tax=Fomitopsis serialis TaxID=139415 RepID=UPI0020079B7C|nr:uncharacterized protein B0H18DRAFT_97408 [Neoantrodia serialis]KAH9915411.1 hypothetical protein B0H18DRAFT_97408 [Neoantrodia serialis]
MLSALPGIVDVSIICGIVCMFASVVCFAIAMLLRTHLKKHEDPARGKRTTESRWTSVPLLFAIPDAWFVWASIAFFAFFLTFYWGRLAHAPGGACGAPIPQIAVGARFYVAASAAFSVLVASGFAHVALVMWACHRLVARDAATPAANTP